jgi:hypothetical protein
MGYSGDDTKKATIGFDMKRPTPSHRGRLLVSPRPAEWASHLPRNFASAAFPGSFCGLSWRDFS